MARVYLARDRFLVRQVAVKILHPALSGDRRFLARFVREAEAAARLNHPHIVSVYDVGHDDGLHYIITEYVPGLDLKNLLLESGPLPIRRVADVGAQVASALQYAHEHGQVHRDVKPHNIMVTPSGLAKVTDFGIANLLSEVTVPDVGADPNHAHYVAPEQVTGGAVTPRTDLYSLAVVLYEAATGFVPFPQEVAVDVAQSHVTKDPIPPSVLHTDVTPELEAVILRAMAKKPRDRYASASEMGAELQRIERRLNAAAPRASDGDAEAAGRPETTPVVASAPRAPARRGNCVTWALSLTTLACVVGAPVLLWQLSASGRLPLVVQPLDQGTPAPIVVIITAPPRAPVGVTPTPQTRPTAPAAATPPSRATP